MLDHGRNFVSRVGHDGRYLSGSKPVIGPIHNFRKLVNSLVINEDGTLNSQYVINTGDLLTRGAVLENDTAIIKRFNVDNTYPFVLAVVNQIKGKDCVGRILVKTKPYTVNSPFAAIRNCHGNHDGIIVRIVNQLPLLGSEMAYHLTNSYMSYSKQRSVRTLGTQGLIKHLF